MGTYVSYNDGSPAAGVGSFTWKTLPVGGGGFMRGIAIASDGTLVGKTDTAGAYRYDGAKWNQLITANSMPQSYINTNPTAILNGAYSIAIAPTNTQIFYMYFSNNMWKSTNQGASWVQLTGFGTISSDANSSNAQYGQLIAVDPNNALICYVGTVSNGLYVTSDGGTTFSAVSGMTTGGGAPGITGIAFYGAGSVVSGVTQTIYACRNGTGVYVTTNGGATWAATAAGGPTDVEYAVVDGSGNYWCVGNSGAHLFKYNGSAWSTLSATHGGSGNFQAIAINPLRTSQFVAMDQAGLLYFSNDTGVTWSAVNGNSTTSLAAPDGITWLPAASGYPGNIYFSAGGLAFSPLTDSLLFASGGTGAWQMNLPASPNASSTLVWNDFSVGIENMVPNDICVPPGLGKVVIMQEDRGLMWITPGSYATKWVPGPQNNINRGWSCDYASSQPSFTCGILSNSNTSGFTTDGVNWTNFSATATGWGGGGCIAASTPQNMIWAVASANSPSYTTNQGATWTQITVPGISGTTTNWASLYPNNNVPIRRVCADRVNSNTFYLYFPGNGVYRTTDGGATWTQRFSGTIDTHGNNSYQNSRILAVPTQAGHLFYTSGQINGNTSSTTQPFYRSTDGGTTWTTVANVQCVACFGFGANAPGQTYPSIHISGFVNNVLGLWRSDDNCATWVQTGTYPGPNGLCTQNSMAADMSNYGYAYVSMGGFGNTSSAGCSYAYLGP